MPGCIVHTIKLKGEEAQKFRDMVCEHYDVIQRVHHSPDGEITYCDMELYPKDSLPKYKERKAKQNI